MYSMCAFIITDYIHTCMCVIFPYVQVALHANSALKETKAQLEGEVTSLNYTMRDREGRYEQEVMKLQVRSVHVLITL